MQKAVVRLLSSLTSNKCAGVLVSPKTILPGLVLSVGFAPWVVSWLVPIREAFALLPQGILSVYLRHQPQRHLVWRRGMVVQIICLMVMIVLAFALQFGWIDKTNQWGKFSASCAFLLLLAVFSIGRSLCSLTVKDIQADLVDKGKRGQLVGMASTLSGLITLVVAVPLVWFDAYQSALSGIGLVGLATLMFIITFVLMLPIDTHVEDADRNSNSGSFIRKLVPKLDADAWRFIFVRSIFVHSALVAPFFMIGSQRNATELMVYFLVAEALAALLSATLWGKLSDYSARSTLRLAGLLAVVACAGLMLIEQNTLWMSAGLFFILSIAHTGVRTGRKTYTLDVKEGQDRTELVGSANSFIGLVLIFLGSVYAGLQTIMQQQVVWVMAAMLVVGTAATFMLASEKDD